MGGQSAFRSKIIKIMAILIIIDQKWQPVGPFIKFCLKFDHFGQLGPPEGRLGWFLSNYIIIWSNSPKGDFGQNC